VSPYLSFLSLHVPQKDATSFSFFFWVPPPKFLFRFFYRPLVAGPGAFVPPVNSAFLFGSFVHFPFFLLFPFSRFVIFLLTETTWSLFQSRFPPVLVRPRPWQVDFFSHRPAADGLRALATVRFPTFVEDFSSFSCRCAYLYCPPFFLHDGCVNKFPVCGVAFFYDSHTAHVWGVPVFRPYMVLFLLSSRKKPYLCTPPVGVIC